MVRTIENVLFWNMERRSAQTAPPPACCHTLCRADDSKLVLFGGGVWGCVYKDVYSFDVERSKWRREDTLNEEVVTARMSHSAVVIDHSMFVYGGMDLHQTFGDILELNLKDMSWSVASDGEGEGPGPRRSHAAVAYQGDMYMMMGHPCPNAGYMWRFSPTQRKWSLLSSSSLFGMPPQPLFGHSAAVSGDYIYIFGGASTMTGLEDVTSARYTNNLYRFHIPTLRWEEVFPASPPPAPRYAHVMGMSGSLIVIHGGDANQCATYFDDIWSIDVSSTTPKWKAHRTGPLTPCKRSGHAGAVVNGLLMVFGGEIPGQRSHESVAYSGATFHVPIGLPVSVALTELCARWLSATVERTEMSDLLGSLSQSARRYLTNNYPFGSKEVISCEHVLGL